MGVWGKGGGTFLQKGSSSLPTFPTPLKSLSPHASSAKLPRSKIEPLEGNAMKTDTGAIGVLGGVGPYAGLDLMQQDF